MTTAISMPSILSHGCLLLITPNPTAFATITEVEHPEKMHRVLAVAVMAFAVVVARVRADEISSEDGGTLCVSKCGTCPVVCSQSPPPPSPSQIYVIPSSPPPLPSKSNPPPSPPSSPPPPPSPKSSTSKPEEQPGGGFSYPYYYFYNADAPQLFVSMNLCLFLSLVYFANMG